jgi:hypothetical protein
MDFPFTLICHHIQIALKKTFCQTQTTTPLIKVIIFDYFYFSTKFWTFSSSFFSKFQELTKRKVNYIFEM